MLSNILEIFSRFRYTFGRVWKGLVGLVTFCKGLVGLGTPLVGFCTHERLNACELVSE